MRQAKLSQKEVHDAHGPQPKVKDLVGGVEQPPVCSIGSVHLSDRGFAPYLQKPPVTIVTTHAEEMRGVGEDGAGSGGRRTNIAET